MIQAILLIFLSFNAWSDEECRVSTSMDGVTKCIRKLTIKRVDSGSGAVGRMGLNVGRVLTPCPTLEKVDTPVEQVEGEKKELNNLSPEFSAKGADCSNFITVKDDSAQYGPWGKEVIGYLEEQGSDSIFMNPDLQGMNTGVEACPNWKNMTKDQKNHFWVWVMASISHIESTCMPDARNGEGTNGVAAGLLQMDERLSNRKWRGVNCQVESVNEPSTNIRCGLDILGQLLEGQNGMYKSNGELWGLGSNSYWQHLRSAEGGGISELIKLNPYCKL